MAEARQRDGGSCAAPVGKRLVQPHGAEKHPGHHIAREDPGRGQLGAIDEDLPDGTEDTPAEERVQIVHGFPTFPC